MTANSTGTPARGTGSRSGNLKAKAAEEFRRFVGLFVYLWILFAVFAINQGIVLRQHNIAWSMQGMAFINALVFAKVMMLFEMFDPGRWLRTRPMIYPILYESFLLMILFLVVHVIEKVVEGAFRGNTIVDSLPDIGGGGLVGLLSAAVIMFVALTPFFALRNLSFALGADRLHALLFGGGAPTTDASER
jgi:hypothetical protein